MTFSVPHPHDTGHGAAPSGVSGRLAGQFFQRWVDRLDAAFAAGSIEAVLPDGSTRLLGGRSPGPQAQIHLQRWSALARLMLAGSVGWFDAWMAGSWTSNDPVQLFALFSANRRTLAGAGRAQGPLRWLGQMYHGWHRNDRRGAVRNIHAHYDLGNSFYAAWLDPSMTYSSALGVRDGEALEVAQRRKIDAVLDRLALAPGASLLEIGCGWGALGRRALERWPLDYLGLTISAAQAEHGRALLGDERIAIRDYRDQTGQFDAIASVEMVEAVGEEYWPAYLDTIARLLRPGGRAAVQYIAIDDAIFPAYAANLDFIQRYVFPGGCLLSVDRFRALAQARGLAWTEQRDFPIDYAETLRRWRLAYDAAVAKHRLPPGFDSDFHRLWRYYLMYCEGGFRGGGITVAQVTLVKPD